MNGVGTRMEEERRIQVASSHDEENSANDIDSAGSRTDVVSEQALATARTKMMAVLSEPAHNSLNPSSVVPTPVAEALTPAGQPTKEVQPDHPDLAEIKHNLELAKAWQAALTELRTDASARHVELKRGAVSALKIQAALEEARATHGNDHPDVKALERELDSLDADTVVALASVNDSTRNLKELGEQYAEAMRMIAQHESEILNFKAPAPVASVLKNLAPLNITSIAWKDLTFGAEVFADQNCIAHLGTLHYAEVIITEWRVGKDSINIALDSTVYQEFVNIVRFMNDLRSPYTVMLIGYSVNEAENRMAFVTEAVGTTLQALLHGTDPLPTRKDRLKILVGVAKSLCYLHSRGIHYRNIKPISILVELPTYRPKLSDFSLASLPEERVRGFIIARYSAPELLLGDLGSLASDVYSLGIVIYETLSGRRPVFGKDNHFNTPRSRDFYAKPYPPLSDDEASAELQAMVEGCLAGRPENRPTITAVTEILEAALRSPWADEAPTPRDTITAPGAGAGATIPMVVTTTTGEVDTSGSVGSTPGAGAAGDTTVMSRRGSTQRIVADAAGKSLADDDATNVSRSGAAALPPMAARTLTAASVGHSAARALADVNIEERLFQKFEQALIPWEDIDLGAGVELGEGAFGTVIKAEHIGSPVAIKILKPLAGREASREIGLFVEEASVLQQVNHLHIVRLMGVCIGEQRYGIVMEFAAGGDLGTYLRSVAGQAADRAVRLGILTDVCKGLLYLHKKRIVHRDIKPANILLDKTNTGKLADFGISGFAAAAMRGGTPRYMAPEVVTGDPCTEPSDVFSFGVVIWEVMSRQLPYPHAKVNADGRVERGNLASPPGPPTGDAPIDAIVKATCALDPAARPTAAALLQSLQGSN